MALPALGIYLWHASAFAGWVVDDAGITFSYARNLMLGHGLVAQPGAQPVEGFTSLSWLVLQTPFLALRAFDPVATPKVLACVCVAVAFAAIGWWLVQRGGMRPLIASSALATTALLPGFVVWCASGLENALYCALLAWLMAATAIRRPRFGGALAGVLVFLVFCTRPDGLLYLWLPPFLAGRSLEGTAAASYRRGFLAGFAVPWLAVTLFRLFYVKWLAAGSNVVVIDSDLAQRFGDSRAVNEALRGLVKLADRTVKSSARAPRRRTGAAR